MKITARTETSEKGLARICQSPRGYIIKCDGKDLGRVGHARRVFDGPGAEAKPWFWYAGIELPGLERIARNTAANDCFYATREEARDACIEWLKATIRQAAQVSSPAEEPKR